MKPTKFLAALLAVCFIALLSGIVTVRTGLLAGLVAYLALDFAFALIIQPGHFHLRSGRCFVPTYIVPILTGYVAEAFRSAIVPLSFFSTDFGKQGGIFAPPVKFGQEVTSKLAAVPTSDRFVPGNGLGSNPQSVKNLATDVTVRINMARKVTLKLPTADAATLMLDPVFKQSVIEAAATLGRDIIGDALLAVNSQNLSQVIVAPVAGANRETLVTSKKAFNKLSRVAERYMLGNGDFISNIADDPTIRSSQFYNQRVDDNPYVRLVSLEGFKEIREFPNMPNGNVAVSTFTANAGTDVCTAAAGTLSAALYLPLQNGDRVQLTTTNALPAGLAVATDYHVINLNAAADTFQLSLAPGGAVIDITDAGAGVQTISRFEALNAVAFEQRNIHIAVRPIVDTYDLAMSLGIPVPARPINDTDPESGLSMTGFLWGDWGSTNPTGDLYCTLVVGYGIICGRGAAINQNNPGPAATLPAGSGLDYAGQRIVEVAHT
jgi:hypothetical protein